MLTAKLAHEIALKELVASQKATIQRQLVTAIEAAISESSMCGKFYCEVELRHTSLDTPNIARLCEEFHARGFYVEGTGDGSTSLIELAW